MVNGESEYPIGSCHTQTKLDFSANSPEIQEQKLEKNKDRNEFLTAAEWTSSIRLRRLLLSLLFFLTQDSEMFILLFSNFYDFPRFFPEKRKTKIMILGLLISMGSLLANQNWSTHLSQYLYLIFFWYTMNINYLEAHNSRCVGAPIKPVWAFEYTFKLD